MNPQFVEKGVFVVYELVAVSDREVLKVSCTSEEDEDMVFWFWLAYSLHILLRPTTKYSYNQPSYTKDINNHWNLVSTYQFISSNGTVEGSSLVEIPDDNTNMFAQFSTSLLAVYFMLTGDSSAVSSWGYKNNWMLVFLIVIFSFFTTIYLLNLFISLLGNAINKKNNEESFLKLKCEILSEIELFWMLPYQRRKKNWFPYILYYEASVNELKKYINNIKDDEEIFKHLLPAIKQFVEIKDNSKEIKNTIKAQIDESLNNSTKTKIDESLKDVLKAQIDESLKDIIKVQIDEALKDPIDKFNKLIDNPLVK
ncbi:hypothetical protein C2G38_2180745 [Gigaspora rosea]|uniref:Ion transport domain-containing protein n=1 Tax=Gigaspora rosea TaxID=44941 RepID=A0A397VL01_9GLOM|nr:hypothetical protein C2G38_2180745 [Gigaspora rosea]